MGNIVDVLPGPPAEAQLRNSEWNKSRPSNYSQASLIEKQKQNSNLNSAYNYFSRRFGRSSEKTYFRNTRKHSRKAAFLKPFF